MNKCLKCEKSFKKKRKFLLYLLRQSDKDVDDLNLIKLFEMQKVLDDRILDEHPELKGQNNLDWKILALQVELGECANEWRGFKKWSKDQEPRIEEDVSCNACDGTGDLNYEFVQEEAEGSGGHEYIDCEICDCTGISGVRNHTPRRIRGLSAFLFKRWYRDRLSRCGVIRN
ncbi:dUTP diphosphatase [Bacillus sp. FSL K6-3431]|uniref:dUTP diphosphatase n=1 Tax=Bacillus sp. FSL K6-3431 TaxID=2921500 RepID=UPI0030FB179C